MIRSAELTPFGGLASPSGQAVHVEVDHEGRSAIYARFRLVGFGDRLVFPELDSTLFDGRERDQRAFTQHTLMKMAGLDAGDLAAPTPMGRTDGLWRSTCLEVFGRLPGGAYVEFNLSPSGQWAAYRFDGYRSGSIDLEGSARLDEAKREGDDFEVAASFHWQGWPQVRELGLSAVVETTGAGNSYWALTHPSDKPDFHHPDSFALRF